VGPRQWKSSYFLAAVSAVLAWFAFSFLALVRYQGFGGRFDSAVVANVLWRISNGFDDVSALTGAHHFGDHASPLLLIFIPVFRWLPGSGVPVLLVSQAFSLALVGWAMWLLADGLDLPSRTKMWLMALGLLGVGSWMAALADFHASSLALGPLAMVVATAVRGSRIETVVVWSLIAALARMELALSVLIVGAVLIWSGYRERGFAALVIGGATALVLGLWMVLTPWAGTSASVHFDHLGVTSFRDLPTMMIAHPLDALAPLVASLMILSTGIWIVSYGLLPLLAGRWVGVAVPFLAVPVLGSWVFADMVWEHYWQILIPVFGVASVFGIARNTWARSRVALVCGFGLVAGWTLAGPIVFVIGADVGSNLFSGAVVERQIVDYVNMFPDASVAVPQRVLSHVVGREVLYVTPEPFACPEPIIAVFRPAYGAPDIVVAEETQGTSDIAAHIVALRMSYHRVAQFGTHEVWAMDEGVDASEVLVVACTPGSGEGA
jgi:uncharacterized membrane protein